MMANEPKFTGTAPNRPRRRPVGNRPTRRNPENTVKGGNMTLRPLPCGLNLQPGGKTERLHSAAIKTSVAMRTGD